MSDYELYNIVGGASFSAAFLSAIIRGINSLLEMGRSVGTAIRRVRTGSMCSM